MPPEREADPLSQMPYDQRQTLQQNRRAWVLNNTRREQSGIEARLARRHLKNGTLVLYDVTSTYLEGRCCPLAQHGDSRYSRPDRPQLVIGLLCALDGCPVAVEVF